VVAVEEAVAVAAADAVAAGGGGGRGGYGGGGGDSYDDERPITASNEDISLGAMVELDHDPDLDVPDPVVPEHKPLSPEIFDTEMTFDQLGLTEPIQRAIKAMGFRHPTRIQAQLVPVALAGKDVLGQAKTGTGKTAAFGLPLLNMCRPGEAFQALILGPTRELAVQIHNDLANFGRFTGLSAVTVYGGKPIRQQAARLARNPEIIVGTPGRVIDMVERGHLRLSNVRFAVLDEVDRMFDIGFRDDIRKILKMCPTDRQTMFVSATISKEIEDLARRHMRDPEKIVTSSGSLTVSLVDQHYLSVQPWDKKRLLAHLLTHEEPALTVVFCRLKRSCDELVTYLARKNIEAHAIHGDLPQSKRNAVMEQLKSGKLEVLIASDLASRGIDVEGISHVINYDLPEDPDIYVHRIGRTARAGNRGVAWSLVTPEQGELLTQIEHLINTEIPKLDYPDFEPGPVPEGFRQQREQDEQLRQMRTQKLNRYATPAPPPASVAQAARPVDQQKFPGGVVPTQLPPKRMFGKVRTSRTAKLDAAPLPPPPPAAP
jgi:ATP-dependent RNA helicase DeaD